MPRQPAACGTAGGYNRHRRAGEQACPACKQAWTEYSRRYVRPERQRAYYAANREQIRERRRAYLEANREAILEQRRAYREVNRERRREYQRAYREANREQIREYQRAYREKAAARRKTPPRETPPRETPPRQPAECGTASGYQRHRRVLGEQPCPACLEAWNEACRRQAQARRPGHGTVGAYKNGCRCTPCIAAYVVRYEHVRQARKDAIRDEAEWGELRQEQP